MSSPSSATTPKDVDLIITPLQPYYKYQLHRVDIAALFDENHRVPLRRLQHWAIQVGDSNVYEVTAFGSTDGSRDLKVSSVKSWQKSRDACIWQTLSIGVTGLSSTELNDIANSIWDIVLEDEYRPMSRNCQAFAELFRQMVHDPTLLTKEKEARLAEMPSSFNPFYALLHLKKARGAVTASKKYAVRWGSLIVKGDKKAAQDPVPSRTQTDRMKSKMPSRRQSRWLQLVNEQSKGREVQKKQDFRELVERVNHLHQTEMESSKRLVRSLPKDLKPIVLKPKDLKLRGLKLKEHGSSLAQCMRKYFGEAKTRLRWRQQG